MTIFCVVCRKGVSKIKFTTMMMVKQKRGRERQHRRQRERERERRSARVSSVAFKRLSRPFCLFSERRPHRKEREREREREREKTEREREEGSDFVLSSAFSRMISKMFNDKNESRKMETKFTRLLPSIRELGPSRRSRSRPRTRVSVDLPPLVLLLVPLCFRGKRCVVSM